MTEESATLNPLASNIVPAPSKSPAALTVPIVPEPMELDLTGTEVGTPQVCQDNSTRDRGSRDCIEAAAFQSCTKMAEESPAVISVSSILSTPPKSSATEEAAQGAPDKTMELDLTAAGVGPPPLACLDSSRVDRGSGDDRAEAADVKALSSAGNKPQSYSTLPDSEDCLPPSTDILPADSEISSKKQRFLAVFGPHKDVGKGIKPMSGSFIARCVHNVNDFRDGLLKLKEACQGGAQKELWLFHVFPTDNKGLPFMGGHLITEDDLYGSLSGMGFARVTVFQLACPTMCDTLGYGKSRPQVLENCTGSCTIDFYLVEDQVCKHDWATLLEAVDSVVAKALDEEGLTAEQVCSKLTARCPERPIALKLRQQSGVPSKERILSLPEQLLDLPTESQPQQQQVFQSPKNQPIQPDWEDQSQNDHPSQSQHFNFQQDAEADFDYECQLRGGNNQARRNACIGITTCDYRRTGKTNLRNRDGAESDHLLIFDISRKLLCRKSDIYRYYEYDKKPTSKENIVKFINSFADSYPTDTELENLYFIVSSHGDKNGIVTAYGETLKLEELLQPLVRIGKRLILVYEPCRGNLEQTAGRPPSLCGLSLPEAETEGCCLPPSMPTCSAMFASMPRYVSYHDFTNGSLMLIGLHAALHMPDLAGKQLTLRDLTQRTQDCLYTRYPGYKDLVQMQYTMRECCSLGVSYASFQTHLEPRIPVFLQFKLRL